jgi:endonuclease III related protein
MVMARRETYFLRTAATGQTQEELLHIYDLMFQHFGDRQWWPAETREEIIIGAILVQSVSWKNTMKAIELLKEHQLLSFAALYDAPLEDIEACVRSTRYYKMKARKLKAFAAHIVERYNGDLALLFAQPMEDLRRELLSIYGIGPETADDIVLYAANMPSFVVDAYTKRIFSRLGWVYEDIPYEVLRQWFMDHLPQDVKLYNQYHALIDGVGHHYCLNQKPKCSECPLKVLCMTSDPAQT